MSRTAYVNGAYLPLEEARISILDRGFLFADGVYEVSAVLGGRLIDNAAHLARLERSLGEIQLPAPVPLEDIPAIQADLVARNGLDEGLVYLQVTRGAQAERDFAMPAAPRPSLVLFTQAKAMLDNPAIGTGIDVVSVPELRWARRDIKSTALLAQVMAKTQAASAGAQEAWMVENGHVTEGASSNAFIITRAGAIVTRPVSSDILSGITRKAVLALAEEKGLDVEERRFTVREAYDAAEAFITSASSLVMPVARIDGQTIGGGKPGRLTLRLRELYLDFARAEA